MRIRIRIHSPAYNNLAQCSFFSKSFHPTEQLLLKHIHLKLGNYLFTTFFSPVASAVNTLFSSLRETGRSLPTPDEMNWELGNQKEGLQFLAAYYF